MLYNVFASLPNHYDRGSHIFLGRMDSSIPFPIKEILRIEAPIGYNFAFYSDDDVLEAESEERERIGGSIFNLDSENIFNSIPVCVYDLDDFMSTLREFVENSGLANDVDDEILDAVFNGEGSEDDFDGMLNEIRDEGNKRTVEKAKVYPKVPFKVRNRDSGYRVAVTKLSSTVSLASVVRDAYVEDSVDRNVIEGFVPDRAARKVTSDRLGDITYEAIPRVVRHLPDSPFVGMYWVVRSSRFKNVDIVGPSKRDALDNMKAYVALTDSK